LALSASKKKEKNTNEKFFASLEFDFYPVQLKRTWAEVEFDRNFAGEL